MEGLQGTSEVNFRGIRIKSVLTRRGRVRGIEWSRGVAPSQCEIGSHEGKKRGLGQYKERNCYGMKLEETREGLKR